MLLLAACTGSTESGKTDGGGGGGGGGGVTCAVPSTSSYSIAWNAVDDANLNGYKIYYGTTSPLTKFNASGSVPIAWNMASATFVPATYDLTTCTRVYLAVTAVGSSKPESALSTVQSIVVE